MNNENKIQNAETPVESGGENRGQHHRRPVWLRVLIWTGSGLAGLLILVILALCVATWWFTPARLASLISKEASENLAADVSLADVNYTLWSTFPHLDINVDSISVRSRTLDSLPDSLKSGLPAGADRLLSARSIKGSINLLRLLYGRIFLRDIEVDSIRVNLVAVTDSINNFDIVPSGGSGKVPYFHIDGLKVTGGGEIAYTGIPSASEASVKLKTASLEPLSHRHHKDNYRMTFDGIVNATSGDLDILHDFPFSLDGDVQLRFDPFGVSTDDYRVALGNIRGNVSMDMNIGGNPSLNRFAYSLNDVTLQDIVSVLPPGDYPVLNNLNANLSLDASARLTSPYDLSSAWLPSAEIDFRVPEGDVIYSLSDNESIRMDRIGLNGRFVFDGRHPELSYIEIPDLYMSGEGVSLNLAGRVTDLTTAPLVNARLTASGDVSRTASNFPPLAAYHLSGDIDLDAGVQFRLQGDNLTGSIADLKVKSEKLGMKYGTTHLTLNGFEFHTRESYPDMLTEGALLDNIPLNIEAGVKGVHLADSRQKITMDASNLAIRGEMGRQGTGEVLRKMNVMLKSDGVSIGAEGMHTDLKGITLDVAASRLGKGINVADYKAPKNWFVDSFTQGFTEHTPGTLQITLPAAARNLLSQWDTRVDLHIDRGAMGMDSYPALNRMKNLDLTATLDSVTLHNLTLSSGDTRGTISARIGNLRQFLLSRTPAPLYVDLNADIDTIQINELARAYTDGHPHSAIARGDKEAMAAGPNNLAVLIPRNIVANVHASARQTRYINLHLYDLLADVRVSDGRAFIDTVHISSDFGEAGLNMIYDTSDLQNMNMQAHLDITDVNVVNFFANFHKLLLMMPEMKNLSGMLSADVDARLMIFPSMYLNVPSVWANGHVRGRDLNVHQSNFIRHVTRMLLLPGDENLQIQDIDVHAGVHSNLLEVFPFTIKLDDYRLILGGLNNFGGDLYYHVGVADWPLKVPFGVNIEGSFDHPKLRFGGKSWHDANGARIAAGIDDNNRINVMEMMRRYMGEFVHTAATYTGD